MTNVQHAGVDEGGIVKLHGDHLVILRRGRLFTVHIGGEDLRPVSAVDAFGSDVDPGGAGYDEMLIAGNTIVVIGYSYVRGGTEIGVFDISRAGQLTYRATYRLRSNDYYSSRNYASRLIGSKLIVYSPHVLSPWGDPWAAFPAMRRWRPGALPADFPPGHVLLTIHGLCMTDTQWRVNGHDHGDWLAQALGCTRLNLRYNTGLHVHDNGLKLALLLERLVANWTVPLTRLSIVAHSMGGLVARSAHAAGVQAGHAWPQYLKDMVFLGTPHHGSPLERAGHWVDSVLAATPFTMPFVKLGQLRSAGIIDLRHGCVLPPDRPDQPDQPRALGRHADTRTPLPLPAGVNCFAVAATLAPRRSILAERLTGDGLVPLHSALGQHDDPRHRLAFEPTHQHVMHRTGHLALLGSQPLAQHMLNWLQTPPTAQA